VSCYLPSHLKKDSGKEVIITSIPIIPITIDWDGTKLTVAGTASDLLSSVETH
tara:strand:- start:220757 stop:220915 length:159 start_codon:yes stop_codon:yes gene_type:complete